MITESATSIRYFLEFENDFLIMNEFLDRNLKITFDGSQCLNCNRSKSIYRQGFVKSAFDIPQRGLGNASRAKQSTFGY